MSAGATAASIVEIGLLAGIFLRLGSLKADVSNLKRRVKQLEAGGS